MTGKNVCSDCRWWHFHPSVGEQPGSEKGVGYCRRFPPTRRENGVGAWPITFGDDWCGEFAARDETARPAVRAATH